MGNKDKKIAMFSVQMHLATVTVKVLLKSNTSTVISKHE